MIDRLKHVSVRRWLGIVIALLTLPCVAYSGGQRDFWGILLGSAAPGVAFFLIWAIPFDIMMLAIFRNDAVDARRRELSTLMVVDGIVLALLVVVWGGFFYSLVNR